jgi:hypothetical protein
VECVIECERFESLSRLSLRWRGDDPVAFIAVGESVSVAYRDPWYCIGWRGAEEEDGWERKCCLLARLEVLDMEEAPDILLVARERIGRCPLPKLDRSSNWGPMPTLPISVPVRSMDETPRSRG